MSLDIPDGIIGFDKKSIGNASSCFDKRGVYIGKDGVTGLCGEVFEADRGMSVLNLKQVGNRIQTSCGHILDGGRCLYLTHVQGGHIQCPLLENLCITPQKRS